MSKVNLETFAGGALQEKFDEITQEMQDIYSEVTHLYKKGDKTAPDGSFLRIITGDNKQKTIGTSGGGILEFEAVKDAFALPAGLDQVGIAQQPELMGYRRLGHAQKRRDFVDAKLGFKQRKQNFHPRGIAENLKKVRKVAQKLILRQSAPRHH